MAEQTRRKHTVKKQSYHGGDTSCLQISLPVRRWAEPLVTYISVDYNFYTLLVRVINGFPVHLNFGRTYLERTRELAGNSTMFYPES